MGDSPKLLVLYGDALRRQGKLDAAIVQYTKALGDPKDPEDAQPRGAHRPGLHAAREAGLRARADRAGDSRPRSCSRSPRAWPSRSPSWAATYQDTSEADKADDAFKRALTADGAYAPAYFHYARFMADARRESTRASTLAQEYLKLAPRGEFASDAQRLVQ